MNEYLFKLRLCDGYECGGTIKINANNEKDAYNSVIEYVGTKLYQAFPELSIDYSVELVE